MNDVRQKNEKWLNPILNARITSHEITWTRENSFQSIQASGDLYFHKIPQAATIFHLKNMPKGGKRCHFGFPFLKKTPILA
ncbi:hypothetical protein SDC9_208321 [bioreactor metagenome]|uniref:Uncharacterized protein n=1 Tax=bioreactor metagenome TaxID=1076179 RepID=A0A645JBR4_9ZZZZ